MRRIVCRRLMIVCLGSLLLPGLLLADDRGIQRQPGAGGGDERRVALVVGNGAYSQAPLHNPVNDVRAMTATLTSLGFQVTARENLDQKGLKEAIWRFGRELKQGGVGLFYFSGHGMQVQGRNYLIPIDARIESERHVDIYGVDAGAVLAEMEAARNRLNIVILDACRNNPFARSFKSPLQGLASMDAPTGTIIAYATGPNKVANDGPQGRTSFYTGALIETLAAPGLKIEDVFKRVRTAVRQKTGGDQIPWEVSSLEGDFYFRPGESSAPDKPLSNKSRLYVYADPSDAIIRIMNIIPVYKPGIELDSGKYLIEVSKVGYITVNRWIELEAGKDLSLNIDLVKSSSSITPSYSSGQNKPSTSPTSTYSPREIKPKTKTIKVLIKDGYYHTVRTGGGKWVKVGPSLVWEHETKQEWVPPQYEEKEVPVE
ncbi:MAG: caspase domain-containing protein [Thermodesulfobacteriota bacterium]